MKLFVISESTEYVINIPVSAIVTTFNYQQLKDKELNLLERTLCHNNLVTKIEVFEIVVDVRYGIHR